MGVFLTPQKFKVVFCWKEPFQPQPVLVDAVEVYQ